MSFLPYKQIKQVLYCELLLKDQNQITIQHLFFVLLKNIF